MSVLAYGLVLLGCADDGSACRPLDLPPVRYVAASTCQADLESALMSDAAMRADYPIVEARCIPLNGNRREPEQARLARR